MDISKHSVGKLLKDDLKTRDFILISFNDSCEGGVVIGFSKNKNIFATWTFDVINGGANILLEMKNETYAEFEKRLIRRDIILLSIAFILPFGFPIALYWLY